MIIKERTRSNSFNTKKKTDNRKIRMDFPNEYEIRSNYDNVNTNYRRENGNQYNNQYQENYVNYNNAYNGSNSNTYVENDSYYDNSNNFEFKAKAYKSTKSKKRFNPKTIVMMCVFTFLAIFVCTLIALNAVPADAENVADIPIVNTDRLEENINNDLGDSIVLPPSKADVNSKNWFDALCDWLTK